MTRRHIANLDEAVSADQAAAYIDRANRGNDDESRAGILRCENCGFAYAESDHVIADVDPGLCPGCAVGG